MIYTIEYFNHISNSFELFDLFSPLLASGAILSIWFVRHQGSIKLLALPSVFLLLVLTTSSGVYLGDILLVYCYRFIIIVSGIAFLISVFYRGVWISCGLVLIVLASLLLGTYIRYVPHTNRVFDCMMGQYRTEIEAYHAANGHYPTDIYARGQDNPTTLRPNLKPDLERVCAMDDGLFILFMIRYDPQPRGYLLRGYVRYDPFLLERHIYRACMYTSDIQALQCHLQRTEPFEPPLENY